MSVDEDVTGRFLVTEADEASAVLSLVETGRLFTLAANPDLDAGDVVEATLSAEGPLGVTWRVVEIADRWRPAVEVGEEPPGRRARSLANASDVGELVEADVDGARLHVVAVDPERTEAAMADVAADQTTRRVAARLDARRVEVRGADGVVSIRYRR